MHLQISGATAVKQVLKPQQGGRFEYNIADHGSNTYCFSARVSSEGGHGNFSTPTCAKIEKALFSRDALIAMMLGMVLCWLLLVIPTVANLYLLDVGEENKEKWPEMKAFA